MRIFIDGKDAFTTYGMILKEGGLLNVFNFHPAKKLPQNDWAEEDGIEVDASEIFVGSKKVSLKFFVRGGADNINSLVADLSNGVYHRFYFDALAHPFLLRYEGVKIKTLWDGLAEIELKMIDDAVLVSKMPIPPQPPNFRHVDLTALHVQILQGSAASIINPSGIKNVEMHRVKRVNGDKPINTQGAQNFKQRDIVLHCGMSADSAGKLYSRLLRLFNEMRKPCGMDLYGGTVYKSMKAKKYIITNNSAYILFDITLTKITT